MVLRPLLLQDDEFFGFLFYFNSRMGANRQLLMGVCCLFCFG
jgi:hypothetical protein